jgi:hypothetical protein
MDFLFDAPGLGLAVRTSIVSHRYDLIVSVTENTFAFITFPGIVERDAVADWTGDEL